MSDFKPVHRCVCLNVSFDEMKRAGIRTVDEVEARFGGARRCGACRDYIEAMLRTGETTFEVFMEPARSTPPA